MMYRGECVFQDENKTNATLKRNIKRLIERPADFTTHGDAICKGYKGKSIKEITNALNQLY